MTVIKKSANVEAYDAYMLSNAPSVKMAEAVGSEISMAKWVVYSTTDGNGEERTVLAVITEDGEIFATISETFIKSFLNAEQYFTENGLPFDRIKVFDGKSKNGRTYIDCLGVI